MVNVLFTVHGIYAPYRDRDTFVVTYTFFPLHLSRTAVPLFLQELKGKSPFQLRWLSSKMGGNKQSTKAPCKNYPLAIIENSKRP
jgi:hypothetical protein